MSIFLVALAGLKYSGETKNAGMSQFGSAKEPSFGDTMHAQFSQRPDAARPHSINDDEFQAARTMIRRAASLPPTRDTQA